MPTWIGLDGFPGGWVAVYLSPNTAPWFDYGSLERLLVVPFERAMIDMPVGLPQTGYRECDIEAGRVVGSRVFRGARWKVWNFPSFDQANAYYSGDGDKRISQQLWCLRHKLKEVNEWITPERQLRLLETHPELVFWRLNGKHTLESKKTQDGLRRRIELLKSNGFHEIESWLQQRRGSGIRRDDLIDACACAVAARESKDRLPQTAQRSPKKIRMAIWY